MEYIGSCLCTDKWGYVLIDKDLWKSRKNKLIKTNETWTNPPYTTPHISFLTKTEVDIIKDKIKDIPKNIRFSLTGETKIITPKNWNGVYSCIIEIIHSQDLINLRKNLGLSEFINNNHEFHITLGIKTLRM